MSVLFGVTLVVVAGGWQAVGPYLARTRRDRDPFLIWLVASGGSLALAILLTVVATR